MKQQLPGPSVAGSPQFSTRVCRNCQQCALARRLLKGRRHEPLASNHPSSRSRRLSRRSSPSAAAVVVAPRRPRRRQTAPATPARGGNGDTGAGAGSTAGGRAPTGAPTPGGAPHALHKRCGWIGADTFDAGKKSFLANPDYYDAIHPKWGR